MVTETNVLIFYFLVADEEKKDELINTQLELEKRQEQERKQDELKFHIQQKQIMVQQQQKHAEKYVMMHANQFSNSYNNLNSMQIPIIPTVDEYDDLMPDPMQYVSLMGAPPPPPVDPTVAQENEAPVLPPGTHISGYIEIFGCIHAEPSLNVCNCASFKKFSFHHL